MANTAKKEADGSSICILMTLISAKIGGDCMWNRQQNSPVASCHGILIIFVFLFALYRDTWGTWERGFGTKVTRYSQQHSSN